MNFSKKFSFLHGLLNFFKYMITDYKILLILYTICITSIHLNFCANIYLIQQSISLYCYWVTIKAISTRNLQCKHKIFQLSVYSLFESFLSVYLSINLSIYIHIYIYIYIPLFHSLSLSFIHRFLISSSFFID